MPRAPAPQPRQSQRLRGRLHNKARRKAGLGAAVFYQKELFVCGTLRYTKNFSGNSAMNAIGRNITAQKAIAHALLERTWATNHTTALTTNPMPYRIVTYTP